MRKISLLPVFIVLLVLPVLGQDINNDDLHVFLLDKKVLAKTKTSLKEGANVTSGVYRNLLKEAGKALNAKPVSVTIKTQIPPSGNKHDYMSLAPYWWADPDSGEGAKYVRKDGERNPEITLVPDHKFLGETNQNIFTLALAYYFSDEEKYAEKAVELLKVWYLNDDTKMNPNLDYAQAVKGQNEGRGSGVLDARSIVYMIDGLGLLEKSKSFQKEDREKIHQWIADYRFWLLESKNGIEESKAKNNHGSWYDDQVMSVSLYLGYTDYAKKYSERLKTLRIDYQFEPDGKQPEELVRTRSLNYSLFNLEAVSIFATICWNLGLDYWHYESADGRSIRKGIDYLYPYLLGEKKWEYKQIAPVETSNAASVYLFAYKFYGEKKYLDLAIFLDGQGLKSHFEVLYQ
jgi:hypothetical protein